MPCSPEICSFLFFHPARFFTIYRERKAELTRLTWLAGFYLGLHLAVIGVHPAGTWGIDSLAFAPWWGIAIFGAGAALVLLPASRKWLAGRVSAPGLDLWGPSPVRHVWRLLALGLLLAIFMAFRTRAHFLGDGEIYLRELASGAWDGIPRTDRSPLVFWLIRRLHALAGPAFPPLGIYRIYSMASGLLFGLAAILLAGQVGRTKAERWITLFLLLTAGSLQIFFGYVENYALVLATILFLAHFGMKAARGDLSPWPAVLLLGVMIPLHLSLVGLLPTVALLPLLNWRRGKSRPLVAAGQSLLFMAAAVVVAGITLFAIGFDPARYRSSVQATQMLPLFGELESKHLYRLISIPHLLDLLNLLALVAPAALLLLVPTAPPAGKVEKRTDEVLFIAAIAAGLGAFVLVANPEIGVFRDWDVLAAVALPLTLFAALRLPAIFPERRRLTEAGVLLCGAALLHTGAWISVNADAVRSEHRFIRSLEKEFLSMHARSYGWETLGSYYRRFDRSDEALSAYQRAVDAAPGQPRLWNSVASMHQQRREFDAALQTYRQALDRDSTFAMTWYNMSVLENDQGRFQEAVDLALRAIRLNPAYAEAFQNLGTAFVRLERYPEAIEAYRKAVEYRPTLADAWFNLGVVYHKGGRAEEARSCFETFLKLKPTAPQAETVRRLLVQQSR